jgi:hypothetical protein
MSNSFPVHLPLEHSRFREVLFAAEIIDAVTLKPVFEGLQINAIGLKNKPIINTQGSFVWLKEGNLQAAQVVIDAGNTPYESVTVAAPVVPSNRILVELSPKYEYPFPTGSSALRGSLIESRIGLRKPVTDAKIWLQWIDDKVAGTVWRDAPTITHCNVKGNFAALLRFSPGQEPRPIAVTTPDIRLKVSRAGTTKTSATFKLRLGRTTEDLPAFVWDELNP